ncbi:MAG: hypothetical protein ACRY3E_03915 [Candidatus Lariskella arthropodorum]
MFKVICDVKLLPSNSWHDDFPNHNIAHAALKYGRIIGRTSAKVINHLRQ